MIDLGGRVVIVTGAGGGLGRSHALLLGARGARVVVNERTGTVVIGQDVQISTVAMTHGTLTVRVTESPLVSQPNALSFGTTEVVPRTAVEAVEPNAHIAFVGGASLQSLVDGLNRIGLKPTDIIAILQAIKSAGALQAELIIQ